MHFVALFHDLGKMGQQEGEYYQPNASQWHIDKLGQVYKFNTDIPAMKIPERALFLLQQIGCKVSQNEYIGIKIHDGLYDESNKPYFMSRTADSKLKTNLGYVMHQADSMAARIEFEMYVRDRKEADRTTIASNFDKVLIDQNAYQKKVLEGINLTALDIPSITASPWLSFDE